VPGRPAVHLSEHYKLDCDYGTQVMALYKIGDGSDAIYVCGNHIGEVQARPSNQGLADVRLVAGETSAPDTAVPNNVAVPIAATAPPKPVMPKPAPVALKTVGAVRMVRAADRPGRAPARDLIYGNAAKALVDESIWNMAPGDFALYRTALQQGRPVIEAALAAGGQLAVVHRKISEYSIKLESVLFESKAKINREDVIDKAFEQAITEIIGNAALGDAEKDAAIAHIGSLQESINRGLEREISPFQAYRVAAMLGERVNWGTGASVSEELKPAYRTVYSSARNALRSSAPHIQILEERLTNLHAAKADLESAVAAKDSQRLTA
jgi:hypothetical protein